MTTLLMIWENILGYMEFFEDDSIGLEKAKIRLQERADLFMKRGYQDDLSGLYISRVKSGLIDSYNGDPFEMVYSYECEQEEGTEDDIEMEDV